MLKPGRMVLVRMGINYIIQGNYLLREKERAYHRPANVEIAPVKSAAVYEKPDPSGRFDQHGIAEANIDVVYTQVLIIETVMTGYARCDEGRGHDQGKKANLTSFLLIYMTETAAVR